jgi:bifunctional non-homologous end joining protein LigD
MAATPASEPPSGEGWAWELKWDGIRGVGYVDGGRMRLFTRNGNEVSHRYPELQALAAELGARDVVLDGEIVAFDDEGRPSFELLQRRMHVQDDHAIRKLTSEVPAVYVLFDLLWVDGKSLVEVPYEQRRAQLMELGLSSGAWQTPPHETGDGTRTLEVSRRFGIEGILAKRLDSRYEPGRRSKAWLKVKHSLRQEFVVGGWLPGEGGREGTIGSLLVGYYGGHDVHDGGRRVLHYAGRVGSGLSHADLAELQRCFEQYARATSPFEAGPRPPRQARWVEPVLVVEVRFNQWTSSGSIRQPTFMGYRTDKSPEAVVREPTS